MTFPAGSGDFTKQGALKVNAGDTVAINDSGAALLDVSVENGDLAATGTVRGTGPMNKGVKVYSSHLEQVRKSPQEPA